MKTNGPNHTIVFTFMKKNGSWCTATFAKKNIFLFFTFLFAQNIYFEFHAKTRKISQELIKNTF